MIKHYIHTASAQPGFYEKAEIDGIIKEMLENDIIESTNPWASPIVLATKRDGSTRSCSDYRRLNAVTENMAYPLPRTDDALDC